MEFGDLAQTVEQWWDSGVDAPTIAAALRRDGVPPPLGAAAWDAGLVSRVMALGRSQRHSVARAPAPPASGGTPHASQDPSGKESR